MAGSIAISGDEKKGLRFIWLCLIQKFTQPAIPNYVYSVIKYKDFGVKFEGKNAKIASFKQR